MPLCYLRAWEMNVCSSWICSWMTLLKLVWRQASMNTCFDKRNSAANFLNNTQATKTTNQNCGAWTEMAALLFSGPDWRAELDVNHADSDILMQPLRPFGSGHLAGSQVVLHQMDVALRELVGKLLGHHRVWTGQAMARNVSLLEWVGGRCDAAVWD